MKVINTIFAIVGSFSLFSCEIEDEYSKPDMTEVLGEQLATTANFPFRLYWTTDTDEIIVVSQLDVTAFGIQKRSTRFVSFPVSDYGYYSAWINGKSIYLLSYSGKLSSVDISTLKFTETLVDSVLISDAASPFSDKHIAFSRAIGPYNQRFVYLYDLGSGKETYVAPGEPWLFSPDGKQLLFFDNSPYVFDLVTKSITPAGQFSNYASILRWTSEGIISFTAAYHNYTNLITVRNETQGQTIGAWKTLEGQSTDRISGTANTIITSKYTCGYPNVTGECPGYTKLVYSIVDVKQNIELPLIVHVNPSASTVAFSPDEKNFAYTLNGQIYLTENEN